MTFTHYFAKRQCGYCHATSTHYVLYGTTIRKTVEQANKIVKWVDEKNMFRAIVKCENCCNSSFYTLKYNSEHYAIRNAELSPQLRSALNHPEMIAEKVLNSIYRIERRSNSSNQIVYALSESHRTSAQELSQVFTIVETYPNSKKFTPNKDFLSQSVQEAFNELEEVKSTPRFAAIAARRLLEVACDECLENPPSKLYNKITKLKEEGRITSDISDWAHKLRQLLNEPVHNGSAPSLEEAHQLTEFADFFVQLLLVYPKQIAKIKDDKDT